MREIESVSERINLMQRPRSIFPRRTRQLVNGPAIEVGRCFVGALADRCGEAADGLNDVRTSGRAADFVRRRAVVTLA
jgi:hypothetical protein